MGIHGHRGPGRLGIAGACIASALLLTASAGARPTGRLARSSPALGSADGGAGAYTVTGTSYDFDLVNNGTTPWQSFVLIGPAGTSLVGGATAGEISAHCVGGQPDGLPNEVECGPLSGAGLAPGAQTLFVATGSAPATCGAVFQLEVISTGSTGPTRVGDVPPAGSCSVAPPTGTVPGPVVSRPAVLRPPLIRGTPVVGALLTATSPSWTARPAAVRYRWQLCTATGCRGLDHATGLALRLSDREAGRSVRLVATATIDGVELTSASARVAVHGRHSNG